MRSRGRGGEEAAEPRRSQRGWQLAARSLPLRTPPSPLLPLPLEPPALLVPPSTPQPHWRCSPVLPPAEANRPSPPPFQLHVGCTMAAILPPCAIAPLDRPVPSVEGSSKQAPHEADCGRRPLLAGPRVGFSRSLTGFSRSPRPRLRCASGFPSTCAARASDWEGLNTIKQYTRGRVVQ